MRIETPARRVEPGPRPRTWKYLAPKSGKADANVERKRSFAARLLAAY